MLTYSAIKDVEELRMSPQLILQPLMASKKAKVTIFK